MVSETRKVGCFPSICPDGKCIQSVSSPGHPTSDHSVGSGERLVVAFLNRLCCSDVLAPLIFRAGSVLLFHCSPLQLSTWLHLGSLHVSTGQGEHFSVSLVGGHHKEGTNA